MFTSCLSINDIYVAKPSFLCIHDPCTWSWSDYEHSLKLHVAQMYLGQCLVCSVPVWNQISVNSNPSIMSMRCMQQYVDEIAWREAWWHRPTYLQGRDFLIVELVKSNRPVRSLVIFGTWQLNKNRCLCWIKYFLNRRRRLCSVWLFKYSLSVTKASLCYFMIILYWYAGYVVGVSLETIYTLRTKYSIRHIPVFFENVRVNFRWMEYISQIRNIYSLIYGECLFSVFFQGCLRVDTVYKYGAVVFDNIVVYVSKQIKDHNEILWRL